MKKKNVYIHDRFISSRKNGNIKTRYDINRYISKSGSNNLRNELLKQQVLGIQSSKKLYQTNILQCSSKLNENLNQSFSPSKKKYNFKTNSIQKKKKLKKNNIQTPYQQHENITKKKKKKTNYTIDNLTLATSKLSLKESFLSPSTNTTMNISSSEEQVQDTSIFNDITIINDDDSTLDFSLTNLSFNNHILNTSHKKRNKKNFR